MAKMGCTVIQGDIEAIVVATGRNTALGKTAELLTLEKGGSALQGEMLTVLIALVGAASLLGAAARVCSILMRSPCCFSTVASDSELVLCSCVRWSLAPPSADFCAAAASGRPRLPRRRLLRHPHRRLRAHRHARRQQRHHRPRVPQDGGRQRRRPHARSHPGTRCACTPARENAERRLAPDLCILSCHHCAISPCLLLDRALRVCDSCLASPRLSSFWHVGQRVEVLCCDKTGTLTQNKMRLTDAMPAFLDGVTGDDLLTAAALATKWWEPPADALDALVLRGVDTASLGDYEQVEFFPFDPATKRTESTLRRKDGSMFKVIWGRRMRRTMSQQWQRVDFAQRTGECRA